MIAMSSEKNAMPLLMSGLMFRGHTQAKRYSVPELLNWEQSGWGLKMNDNMEVVFGAIGTDAFDAYVQDDTGEEFYDDSEGSAFKTFGSNIQIVFDWKVSSEHTYDIFIFTVGDVQKIYASGETDWDTFVSNVPAGSLVTFQFIKDGSVTEGSDTMFIRSMSLKPHGSLEETPAFNNDDDDSRD